MKPTGQSETKSDGGPSSYYDFLPDWVTFNDFMEHKSMHQWGGYALHMKDVGKALCRFGVKEGTSRAYDARKIVYSGLRLLTMLEGRDAVAKELKRLADDPQFRKEDEASFVMQETVQTTDANATPSNPLLSNNIKLAGMSRGEWRALVNIANHKVPKVPTGDEQKDLNKLSADDVAYVAYDQWHLTSRGRVLLYRHEKTRKKHFGF